MENITTNQFIDLSSNLGYGLIYKPVLAFVNRSIHPLIIRPVRNYLRRKYTKTRR